MDSKLFKENFLDEKKNKKLRSKSAIIWRFKPRATRATLES
jgi:hypothetical protein